MATGRLLRARGRGRPSTDVGPRELSSAFVGFLFLSHFKFQIKRKKIFGLFELINLKE